MHVSLVLMTKALCRRYFQAFESDPDTYMDMRLFRPFRYSDARADAYFDRQREKRRIFFAILRDGEPVGEILLKDIDPASGECTLGVHLQNDSVKGQGIGTEAERLALAYAFSELGMRAVNADAVLKNTRSQHVLEKAGFQFQREEGIFRYYRCTAGDFQPHADK